MIRVKIIKNGIQTHGAQFNTQAEADAWIAEGTAQQWWGDPAEFEVQIEDITAEIEAQKAIDQALKFLSDTDWMVIRQAETGVPVPQEILEQRAQARILISKKREQKKGF